MEVSTTSQQPETMVGDVRTLRKIANVQSPSMPILDEESEDMALDHNHRTGQLKHTQSYPELSALSYGHLLRHQLQSSNSIQAIQIHQYMRTNSLGTSQLSRKLLPEICEDSMGPPTNTVAPSRAQLLGVPNHFLTSSASTAPDLTRSNSDLPNGVNQSSPDLLQVETTTAKPLNTSPVLTQQQEKDVAVECANVTDGKLEMADCTEPAVSVPQRIYGRFSSADEMMVKEKKAEELEAKFVFLTSGLDTQKETLDKRIELTQHTRASTEESLRNEINSVLDEIRVLISRDVESIFRAELRSVEKRLQHLMPIAIKLESKAETYGAVKQEQKQLNAAESMVQYVEHLKRINTRETNDHHATREKLIRAKQEWNGLDIGDSSVNVNITRRSSTVGGQTQTLGKRRASVSIASLPNILGGQGLKQLSALQKSQSSSSLLKHSAGRTTTLDPRSRFQHIVRKSSLNSMFRRTSHDSNSSDYTELPAVTVSRPPDSPSIPSTPMRPRNSSFSIGDTYTVETNNNTQTNYLTSRVAEIKTICSATPSVETIERPEKAEVKTAIRRRRSMKRSDTCGSRANSIDIPSRKVEPSQLSILTEAMDKFLSRLGMYRLCKDNYQLFNEKHPHWKRQFQQILFILLICFIYLRLNVLLSVSHCT